MTKKQIPFNVLPTKKVKKALFTTLATVTVLSQMLTVYPTTSAAAEGSEIGTTEAATQVGDFAALKDALEKDNGITNIELTADITMTGPINVHLNKTEVTINGNGHTFTESKLNLLSYTATVYVAPSSKMKTMNIKNMKIRGTHYYSTFQVHDAVTGVVQNFENIDYVGPQMVANTYGTANFTGTNTVNISQFDNVGTLYQMVRANKVNIAGNFTADHNTDGLNTFQLYGTNPQLNILDNANVNIKVKHDKLIGSAANTTDFTVGKNATLNIDTVSELFVGGMSNIIFDTNSTTTINRTGVGAGALMEVAKNFTINSNASLVAKQPAAATAHIIRTTVANATININDPRKLDLDASGTGANRVFSAYGKTTINFNNLSEIGVFNATNKTETPTLAWQDATFQVVQASAQAGIVQTGAISSTNDIQTKFVLADAKRITTTGTAEIAQKAVNELFTNNDTATDTIKDTTTQASIDAAQALVNKVTDPATKAALQKDLDRAQELLNERNAANSEKDRQAAALKAVNELFNNDQPSTDAIKDSTNQEAIDAAQKLVDAVTDPVVKAELQKDLDRAQELLDARNAAIAAEKARQEAALKAVNELFNSDQPSTDAIKDITNQEAIDAAQKLVDAVTDPSVKAELQKDLDRAQELLDARNAAIAAEKARQEAALKAVNELFNSDQPSTDAIKDITNQEAIDAAQKLVDAVTDPSVKAELQKDLDRAQELLDARNAVDAAEKARQEAALKAVNELFNSDNPSTDAIKGSTTQDSIDVAQKLVDAVTDPAVKAALQKDLDRAQELLDARNAAAAEKARQEAAEKAVNELFNSDKPSTDMIKDTTTQATIDAAQKLIDAVTDPAVKAALQKDLNRAQELLNERLATVGTITPADFLIGGDKYVTGTFTGSVAKVSLLVNDKEYTGGTVKADGTFTFYANDKNIKKTDEVFAVAYDKYGKELSRTKVKFVVVTTGKITPATYSLATDKNITGAYTEDVTKITVTVGDKVYKGGTVANGTFTFYAFDKIKNTTDPVTIHAYDAAGKLLDTKTLKVVTGVPVVTKGSITPLEMAVPGDKNITGTYTDDVHYVVVTVNGVDYKGGTFADGEFKFYALDKISSANDVVTMAAYDKAGKLLDTKTIKLVGPAPENVIKGAITPNQLVLGTDKNITGTYTGEVKSVQVTVNGTTYKGGTFTDGEFKFYSHDKVKSVTDEVIIVALDKAGNVLDTKTIEVVK
ncbi:hypothetical protein HCA63_13430 [Listeria booriae]|uniref:immunoglobulin-like domain-containing protein n=1 Tax=Listeria booriae TaxID=1552123 RepID=UPI001627EE05|nr:immunoglobulin-like domain-containing protein [Listeria booriae]MBC1889350.1 hypothetical protein [Listeria booriae]